MKNPYFALAAIGSVFALAAAPALAESRSGTAMIVPYGDLNLESAQGQQALERRIDQAARKICRMDAVPTGTRVQSNDALRCYREARARAAERLTALVNQRRIGG